VSGVYVVFVCISVGLWFRSDVLLLGQREGSDCLLGSLLFGYKLVEDSSFRSRREELQVWRNVADLFGERCVGQH
jgi:hypothetical protein